MTCSLEAKIWILLIVVGSSAAQSATTVATTSPLTATEGTTIADDSPPEAQTIPLMEPVVPSQIDSIVQLSLETDDMVSLHSIALALVEAYRNASVSLQPSTRSRRDTGAFIADTTRDFTYKVVINDSTIVSRFVEVKFYVIEEDTMISETTVISAAYAAGLLQSRSELLIELLRERSIDTDSVTLAADRLCRTRSEFLAMDLRLLNVTNDEAINLLKDISFIQHFATGLSFAKTMPDVMTCSLEKSDSNCPYAICAVLLGSDCSVTMTFLPIDPGSASLSEPRPIGSPGSPEECDMTDLVLDLQVFAFALRAFVRRTAYYYPEPTTTMASTAPTTMPVTTTASVDDLTAICIALLNPTTAIGTTTVTDSPTTVTDAPTTVTDAATTLTDAPTTVTDAPTTVTDAPTTATRSPIALTRTTGVITPGTDVEVFETSTSTCTPVTISVEVYPVWLLALLIVFIILVLILLIVLIILCWRMKKSSGTYDLTENQPREERTREERMTISAPMEFSIDNESPRPLAEFLTFAPQSFAPPASESSSSSRPSSSNGEGSNNSDVTSDKSGSAGSDQSGSADSDQSGSAGSDDETAVDVVTPSGSGSKLPEESITSPEARDRDEIRKHFPVVVKEKYDSPDEVEMETFSDPFFEEDTFLAMDPITASGDVNQSLHVERLPPITHNAPPLAAYNDAQQSIDDALEPRPPSVFNLLDKTPSPARHHSFTQPRPNRRGDPLDGQESPSGHSDPGRSQAIPRDVPSGRIPELLDGTFNITPPNAVPLFNPVFSPQDPHGIMMPATHGRNSRDALSRQPDLNRGSYLE